MPHPEHTAQPEHPQLRLADVAQMGAAKLQPLLHSSFTNLVTAAIADATGHLPRSSRKLLHGPHFRDDLLDALQWAEGELQVASERLTWTKEPRAERVTRQLQQVRAALHQARAEDAERRREHQRHSAGHRIEADAAATARSWLRLVFPDHFHHLLAQEYAATSLDPRQARPEAADVFDAIEAGCAESHLFATMTPAVSQLLSTSPLAFRNTAAADARNQDQRTVELRHPLLLRRWRSALDELAQMTPLLARASSLTALGSLTVDLDELPRQTAFATLNARRFFVAVQQRQSELTRTARQYAQTITEREQDDPHHQAHRRVFDQALQRLADDHPDAYEHIRHRLQPFETSPGRLDPAALNSTVRRTLKQRVVAELAPPPAVYVRHPDTSAPPRPAVPATPLIATR